MKSIKITLYKGRVVSEVKNVTFLEGRGQQDKAGPRTVYNIQLSDEQAHLALLMPLFDAALKTLEAFLWRHMAAPGTDVTEAGDALPVIDRYGDKVEVTLRVDDRFNTSHTATVMRLAHQYMVDAMLQEWYRVTLPEKSQAYGEQALLTLERMKACFIRLRPARPAHEAPSSGLGMGLGMGRP